MISAREIDWRQLQRTVCAEERVVPARLTHVSGRDVVPQTAKTLGVYDVEPAADQCGGW